MPRSSETSPSEAEWHRHKNTIRDIYLHQDNNLETLIRRMRDEHGFVASKSQYERKFKEKTWNFRKNLNNTEWEYVLKATSRREGQGKISKVLLFGFEITPQAIKKKKGRFSLGELSKLEDLAKVTSPRAPDGIIVRSPSPFQELVVVNSPSKYSSYVNITRNSMTSTSPAIPCYFSNGTTLGKPASLCSKNSVMREIAVLNIPYLVLWNMIKWQDATSLSMLLGRTTQPQYWIEETSTGTEMCLFEMDDSEQIVGQFNIEPLPNRILDLFCAGFAGMDISHMPGPATKSEFQCLLVHRMAPFMLGNSTEALVSQIERLLGPNDLESLLEFLKLVTYTMSNHLLLAEFQIRIAILDWIVRKPKTMLERIFAIESLTVKAFWEAMVKVAQETMDYAAGNLLLDVGIRHHLYFGFPERYLALAVEFGHFELVTKLLSEVNEKSLDLNSAPYKIFTRVRSSEQRDPSWPKDMIPMTVLGIARDVKVAKALLDAGADVNARHYDEKDKSCLSPINRAAGNGDLDLVNLFIRYAAAVDDKHSPYILLHAVASGKAEMVQIILSNGAQFNPRPKILWTYIDSFHENRVYRRQWTELQLAASFNRLDVMSQLLHSPVARKELQQGKMGWAPLRNAAERGHLSVVKLLVRAGANVNATTNFELEWFTETKDYTVDGEFVYDRFPTTALLAAVEEGHVDVAEFLINQKAEVNALALGKYGASALEAAYNLNNVEMIELLLKYGGKRFHNRSREDQLVELRLSAHRGDIRRAMDLVEAGTDPFPLFGHYLETIWSLNAGEITLLCDLCLLKPDLLQAFGEAMMNISFEHCCYIKVMALLEAGVPIGDSDLIVKRLSDVTLGADQDFEESDFLEILTGLDEIMRSKILWSRAARTGDLAAMQHLTTLDLDENIGRIAMQTALKLAVGRAYQLRNLVSVECVRFLIEYGADVNFDIGIGSNGRTALQAAAALNFELTQLLLNHGANIDAVAHYTSGRTALQEAASNGSLETVKLLLERGADVNAPPAEYGGITALQGAAIQGRIEVAQLLLERDADPNAAISRISGRTALEGAAERGRLDMVSLLLNAGAHPTESAIEYAEVEGYYVVAKLIRDHMRTGS